jgi:transposase
MRRIRQVLQLHFGVHASARVIAREVGVGRTTVQDYLARANAAGLGWPLASDLTDEALEQLLFPAPSHKLGARHYPEPDWAALVREMKRPGVSLSILWEEYDAVHPQGWSPHDGCAFLPQIVARVARGRRLSPQPKHAVRQLCQTIPGRSAGRNFDDRGHSQLPGQSTDE